MSFVPYLNFNGNCEQAFRFYAELLGGKVEDIYRFGEMPPGPDGATIPVEAKDKVMHARLIWQDHQLMGADMIPGFCGDAGFQKPQGFSVSLTAKDVAEGEKWFNALAEGGTIQMPFAPTFFSQGFGQVIDRFGIPWMVDVAHKGDQPHE